MPPFGREYILCEMAEEKVRKYKASGLPRIKVPEQDPRSRSSNFEEVPYGVSLDMAMDEASRCLQCPKPRCSAAWSGKHKDTGVYHGNFARQP